MRPLQNDFTGPWTALRSSSGRIVTSVSVLLVIVLCVLVGCSGKSSPENSAEIEWDPALEVASGASYRGPWRMNRSTFRYVDDPNVSLTDGGEIGVVWVDQSRKDIFFQRFGADGSAILRRPVNVSRSSEIFSWFPDLIVSDRNPDRVYVLWQEIVFSGGSHGGEIFFARSTDGGRTFEEPLNLSRSEAGDGKGRLTDKHWDNGSLDLELGPQGRVYAAWTEYEGRLWFRQSEDSGKTFSDPRLVAGGLGEKPARGPALAPRDPHSVYLAWTVGEDIAADIRVDLLNNRGRSYERRRKIHPAETHADAPDIAVDDTGTVHLVYGESFGGPFRKSKISYTRKENGQNRFREVRGLSDRSGGRYTSGNYPALGLDASGNPYVLWELFTNNNRRPKALGFTYSGDRGKSFYEPSVVPGSQAPSGGFNGSRQGFLMGKLSVNGRGGIAVVNSDFIPGRRSQILLFRGRPGN